MPEPNIELRAARRHAGLSRPELAEAVAARVFERSGREAPVDGHYVAKLERGAIRWPGREYRAALRDVLDAATDAALGFRPPGGDGAPTLLAEAADADTRDRLARVLQRPHRVDLAVVDHLARVLAEQRHLEDLIGPRRLVPSTLAQIGLVDQLACAARESVRAELLAMGSQYQQFAAWQHEDMGDPAGATAHYDRAMDAAQEIGDHNMISSVLSLKSHLAWSQGDPARAVGLACAGQRDATKVSPGVLALIVQQEARGRAMDGEGDAVDRLLDRSAELTARAVEHPEDEPPWVYFAGPGRAAFQRGVAYVELGRHRQAVDLFEAARAWLPAEYRRDHGRFAANLALACALDGDVERALAAGREALGIAVETGSAYTTRDLRRMRRVLDRWGNAPAVREFDDEVAEATR